MDRISTGIEGIDRQLLGGIPPGSLIAIVAEPQMQSEAILHEMIRRRPTLYITTIRDADIIRDELEALSQEQLAVKSVRSQKRIDHTFAKELTGSATHAMDSDQREIVDRTYELIQQVDTEMNVIIDPTNPLEETQHKSLYRELLNELKSVMHETDNVGVLHCLTGGERPPFRDLTLNIADIVLQLKLASLNDKLEYQVTIPKNRNDGPMLDTLSIRMDERIWVDESRNIS